MGRSIATAPSLDELRCIDLFKGLNDEALASILTRASLELFPARASLGNPSDLVISVLLGACLVMAFAPNGAAITLLRLSAGMTYGVGRVLARYNGLQSGVLRVVAERESTLITLPCADFATLLTEIPALHLPCATLQSRLHLQMASRYYELATLDVRGRLLAELMRMADAGVETDGRLIIDPAPTHAALGSQIGAAREAVTRQLLEFEREGLIESSRRSIVVIDPARLRQLEEAATGRRFFSVSPRSEQETP